MTPMSKKLVIRLSIQKPARRAGITNGHQLSDATGLSINSSYDLWNERVTRIDLTTLAKLCDVFGCTIATILKLTKGDK